MFYPLFYRLRAKVGGEPIDRESVSSPVGSPVRATSRRGPAGSQACQGALDAMPKCVCNSVV